ncbi:MAG: hypothetical protein ACYDEV_04865 [Acidiferrobacter sp.]
MSARPLAFDEGPPVVLVLRSFLLAPWFLAAAGFVLLLGGPQALSDRYTPTLLAATHLVTIGFLVLTATTAVFQLLPVLSGTPVYALDIIAPIVQWGFAGGAILLAVAFIMQKPLLFDVAAVPLGCAVIAFIVPTGVTLRKLPKQRTLTAMRYALAGLAVALIMGLVMAVQRGGGQSLSVSLMALHPLWALVGGFLVLWGGVALQVLPMFQGVRPWSKQASSWVGPALLGLLTMVLWASAAGWPSAFEKAGLLAMAVIAGFYGVLILQRLWTRGRRRRDPMTYFWYLGLAGLLWACLLSIPLIFARTASPQWPIFFGVVVILGAAVPFISGMLYKIVPFLLWLHLQRKPGHAPVLMQAMIKERWIMAHFGAHVAALCVTLMAIHWPILWARAAGSLWILVGILLGVNLFSASLCYRRALRPLSVP